MYILKSMVLCIIRCVPIHITNSIGDSMLWSVTALQLMIFMYVHFKFKPIILITKCRYYVNKDTPNPTMMKEIFIM